MGKQIQGETFASTSSDRPQVVANPKGRLNCIELLRFLLALSVVFYHYYYYGPLAGYVHSAAGDARLLPYLFFAVHAFFVLSGFVIIMSVRSRTPADFFVARMARLGPVLLVCSTVTFFMPAVLGFRWPPGDLFRYLGSISILPLLRMHGLDYSLWSLTYELRFYLLVFVLMFLTDVRKRALALAVAFVAMDAIFIAAGFWWAGFEQYNPFMFYAPYFAVGILFFVILVQHRRDGKVVAAMIVALAEGGVRAGQDFDRVQRQWNCPPASPWHGFVIAAAIVAVVALFARGVRHAGASKVFSVLGLMSYPLYVLHQRCGYWALSFAARTSHDGRWSRPLLVLGMVGASFVIARYVEPHLAKVYSRLLRSCVIRASTQREGAVPANNGAPTDASAR